MFYLAKWQRDCGFHWINKGIRLSPPRLISRIRSAMFRCASIDHYVCTDNHCINYAHGDRGRLHNSSGTEGEGSEVTRRGLENPSSWIRQQNRAMTRLPVLWIVGVFDPRNLLVTTHVLISPSFIPSSSRSFSLFPYIRTQYSTRCERRLASPHLVSSRPFRFACRNYSEQPRGS